MHTATITLDFDQKTTASVIYKSLLPELSKKIPYTSTKISQKENALTITISAEKTPVLRAAINSYSRWIQTALSVANIDE